MDSLDESGELTQSHIDKVIDSIKRIQQLDPTKFRKNKIIITSRPVSEGLKSNLFKYKPFEIKEKGQSIPCFISIYGFKTDQFNHWLTFAIKNHPDFINLDPSGFAEQIVEKVKEKKLPDLYSLFVENKILTASELRKPIFAYMIYQLIVNDISFSLEGKIGIYLSFINLLTQDAKYKYDPDYNVNIKEEIKLRNVLHATAALWLFEKQKGKQGTLRKADLCRKIAGEVIDDDDTKVLNSYKEIKQIQFLSHSYFGEADNVLHFQHQSFAEILLAEYYLKVLLKFALDKNYDLKVARSKLFIGEPTEQTIIFLKDLIILLTDCAKENDSQDLLNKRRLLAPLIASLATSEYNKDLYSEYINLKWFDQINFNENKSDFPESSLEQWVIKKDEVNKIMDLIREIIDSDIYMYLGNVEKVNALFNKEIIVSPFSLDRFPPDIDRWIALIVGDSIIHNMYSDKYFASSVNDFKKLYAMVFSWNNYNNEAVPIWARNESFPNSNCDLFRGIDMSENTSLVNLSNLALYGFNFSNSYLKNITFDQSNLNDCIFEDTILNDVSFSGSTLYSTSFLKATLVGRINFSNALIFPGMIMPYRLSELYIGDHRYINCTPPKCYINKTVIDFSGEFVVETLKYLIVDLVKKGKIKLNQIRDWFEFDSKETKDKFFEYFFE